MNKYLVTVEFEMIEVCISADSESEARRKARERFRKGTLKPKLLPSKYSGRGENPSAEKMW
jgi:hypothetical protein